MKYAYAVVSVTAWVYGLVWLFHDDHLVWGAVACIAGPIAWVYGAGHLMGAW